MRLELSLADLGRIAAWMEGQPPTRAPLRHMLEWAMLHAPTPEERGRAVAEVLTGYREEVESCETGS